MDKPASKAQSQSLSTAQLSQALNLSKMGKSDLKHKSCHQNHKSNKLKANNCAIGW